MNVGVNKSMAPPIPPAKTGQKKEVKLNAMPWFHGKVCIVYGTNFEHTMSSDIRMAFMKMIVKFVL